MNRYLFLKVTNDKYELPIAIFDTKKELAIYEGLKPNTIQRRISKKKRKIMTKYKYIKVIIE